MPGLLIIENDPAKLQLLTLLLTGAGHAVMFATDADGGLLMARLSRPALILMNPSMHGRDGLTATAIFRGDPITANIPILAPGAMGISPERGSSGHAYVVRTGRCRVYEAIGWLLTPSAALDGPAQGPS
jgi:two-component system cell cycle response regulator DivK